MADAILVVNAGSSSLKFSLFVVRAETSRWRCEDKWRASARRRVVAKDPSGAPVAERSWRQGEKSGKEAGPLRGWLRERFAGDRPLPWDTGLFMADSSLPSPSGSTTPFSRHSSGSCRSRPCTSRTISRRSRRCRSARRTPAGRLLRHGLPSHEPDVAQRFALPEGLHDAGVWRYGFHGLSYEYIASALPAFDPKAAAGKTVVPHLGNGSSMCAMEAGRSVASTMGFTTSTGCRWARARARSTPA